MRRPTTLVLNTTTCISWRRCPPGLPISRERLCLRRLSSPLISRRCPVPYKCSSGAPVRSENRTFLTEEAFPLLRAVAAWWAIGLIGLAPPRNTCWPPLQPFGQLLPLIVPIPSKPQVLPPGGCRVRRRRVLRLAAEAGPAGRRVPLHRQQHLHAGGLLQRAGSSWVSGPQPRWTAERWR